MVSINRNRLLFGILESLELLDFSLAQQLAARPQEVAVAMQQVSGEHACACCTVRIRSSSCHGLAM
jgi:hypothetical protein